MNEITKHITVDLSRNVSPRVIFAKQLDHLGRQILVSLTDNGKDYRVSNDAVASFNVLRPDGELGKFTADITEDGRVLLTLTSWMLEISGEITCSIALFFENGARISSPKIFIEVCEEVAAENDIGDTESVPFLTKLLTDCIQVLESEDQRAEAEGLRVEAERMRVEADNDRTESESRRAEAERMRVEADNDRAEIESRRAEAERMRVEADNDRAETESRRAEAERGRDENEKERESNESLRNTQEDLRNDAENQRIEAEKARVAAEEARVLAESLRENGSSANSFPVGAVYISFDSTAPASIFGGTWEAIENGRFLRANSKASGTTGGTERHFHEMWMATANMNVDDVGNLNYKSGYSYNKDHMFMNYTYDKSVNLSTAASDVQGEDFVGVQVTGITNDENSVPPYVTVYMWRRVA